MRKRKKEKKKNKMWPIQPGPKNWQCGMKMKRWDQFQKKIETHSKYTRLKTLNF